MCLTEPILQWTIKMPIEYISKDLWLTDAPAILHGCNAQGVMNAGIGRGIRERYPQAYTAYKSAYNSAIRAGLNHLPVGDVYAVQCSDRIILNAITQCYYGRHQKRYVSYDAIATAAAAVEAMKLACVAAPKIGAGLGGGDWQVIEAIFNSECINTVIRIYTI